MNGDVAGHYVRMISFELRLRGTPAAVRYMDDGGPEPKAALAEPIGMMVCSAVLFGRLCGYKSVNYCPPDTTCIGRRSTVGHTESTVGLV